MIYLFIVLLCAFLLATIVMANEDDKYQDDLPVYEKGDYSRKNYRVEDNKISITLFFILLIFLAVAILYVIVSDLNS